MESVVAAKIAAAVERRRGGRERIDALHTLWSRLVEQVDVMAREVDSARLAVGKLPAAGPEHGIALAAVGRLVDGRLRKLRDELAGTTVRVVSVRNRIWRDTVNIGVIGSTKAGKSTLLRAICELPESVIPSSRDNPTTAARSRIYHEDGAGRAVLKLRTWASFRDEYLAPLHLAAGLPAVPGTPEAFQRFAYPSPETFAGVSAVGGVTNVSVQPFLRKLREAQGSLDRYLPLLQSGQDSITKPLSELRPYVAYPLNEGDRNRLYHAVRDVFVYCPFPGVDVTGLGIIDLPGAGEAGLDIDRQFLRDLRDDVDLLIQVKRPDANSAFFTTSDHATLNLAETGRGDVDLGDFVLLVVNRDAKMDPDSYRNAVDKTENEVRVHRVRVLECQAVDEVAVRGTLLPLVLDLLAERLARMDNAAMSGVRGHIEQLARRAQEAANDTFAALETVRGFVPSGQLGFRDPAMKLRKDVAEDLIAIVDSYDRLFQDGVGCPETDAAVEAAVAEAREWVRDGFGYADRDAWFAEARRAINIHHDRAREEQFTWARAEFARIFGRIDTSLDAAVGRLWDDIVGVLRKWLTDAAVPAAPAGESEAALRGLLTVLNRADQPVLTRVITELVDFRANYGSVYLRVCQPIVAQIRANGRRFSKLQQVAQAVGTGVGAAASAAGANVPWWFEELGDAVTERASAAPKSPLPTAPTPGAPVRPDGGSRLQTSQDQAVDLRDEMTRILEHVVDLLGVALRRESVIMTAVLDSAINHFTDGAVVTPGVENEFEALPEFVRRRIWPELYDGAGPAAATALRQAETATQAVRGTAAEIAGTTSRA